MSLRTSLNKLANKVRAIPASSSFDERTTSVTIRTSTYAGGRVGAEGDVTHEDLVLTPRPKVRELSGREIAGSGGRYQQGDVRVGPITPAHPGGGYTPEQLAPEVSSNGVRVIYVLQGGISGEYTRLDLSTDRSHSYFLILRRTRSTP